MLPFLLATQIACVTAFTLRGVAAPAKESTSSAKSTKPSVDDRGERGHFYYAEKCEDCVYKTAQCGCQPAMEYMACLTKHCGAANGTAFVDKCAALGSKCSPELDIDCRSHDTVCKSKNFQLPKGGVGLKVEVIEDDAFCGPTGKCIGQLRMKATILNAPKEASVPDVVLGSPAPAPSTAASPAAASPSGPAAAAPTPMWLECGLANKKKADIDNKGDWNICQKETDGEAEVDCELPLPDDWIKASETQKAYCVLKEAEDGKRLTQPSWHSIGNVHEKSKEVAAKEAAEEKEVEVKAAADDEKEAVEPKKAKTDDTFDITDKPPWMEDKEERQRLKKDHDKITANTKAMNPKKDKKKAPKKVYPDDHESGLPWMDGKPPTPSVSIFNKKAKKAKEAKTAANTTAVKKEEPKKEEPKKETKKEEPKKETKEEPKKDDDKKAKASAVVKTEDKKKKVDDSDKLPWMVDKAERQAEAKAEAAAKAKEPKEDKKKKKAPKKVYPGDHESGLPWMEGKPPTPETLAILDN